MTAMGSLRFRQLVVLIQAREVLGLGVDLGSDVPQEWDTVNLVSDVFWQTWAWGMTQPWEQRLRITGFFGGPEVTSGYALPGCRRSAGRRGR